MGSLRRPKAQGARLCASSEENQNEEPKHRIMSSATFPSLSASAIVARTTPYQKLVHALHHDPRIIKEITMDKRVGFYRFRGDLGIGNFSQVKMAVHDLCKERVAIKILDKSKFDQKARRMVNREILAVDTIHHPNIIRLYEVLETYSRIHLVFEFASGGELFNRITTAGRFQEADARGLFAQIVSAVKYMHEKKFVHRDIKAENVFFAGPRIVKVGDFGFSIEVKEGHDQLLTTFCGSPPYAAPELFRDESYVGASVDVWALGVLLYFMVSGQMPFKAQTVASLKRHIIEGKYSVPGHVSGPCRDVIEGILKQAPQERLSLVEVQNSEWLRETPFPSSPGPTEKYSLVPTVLRAEAAGGEGDAILSCVEVKAREHLRQMGITEQMVQESIEQGVRNPIIGAYRIAVHRLQRLGSQDEEDTAAAAIDGNAAAPAGSGNVAPHSSLVQRFSFRLGSGSKVGGGAAATKQRKTRSATCALL